MATMFATFAAKAGLTAAAAGATGAAAATGALGIASTASTVLGGLSAIMGAASEANTMRQEAQDEELRANQDVLQGRQDALETLKIMNDDMAKIAVAGFASGLGAEGSIATAQDEARKTAERNISVTRENANFSASARRANASSLRKGAGTTIASGFLRAASGGMNLFDRRAARG